MKELAKELLELLPEARKAYKAIKEGRQLHVPDRVRLWVESHAKSVAQIALGERPKRAPAYLMEEDLEQHLTSALSALLWLIDARKCIESEGSVLPWNDWKAL